MSSTMEPAQIIRVLNELFDCQVPAIERRGGEVLKFIGDGLLAIFPIEGDIAHTRSRCDAALQAAGEAFESLARLNDVREKAGALLNDERTMIDGSSIRSAPTAAPRGSPPSRRPARRSIPPAQRRPATRSRQIPIPRPIPLTGIVT
jgi:hypothetical protein